MSLCILSHLAKNYKPLAKLTFDGNKKLYANKWNHAAINDVQENWHHAIGFDKIRSIKKHLASYSAIWYLGTDTLITNFNINISDFLLETTRDILITADVNGINADSFIICNTEIGNKFLDEILKLEPIFQTHHWVEQQAMIELLKDSFWNNNVEILPQRSMNSYDYNLYNGKYSDIDQTGHSGQWQSGDFVIHWPGLNLQKRFELFEQYKDLVIK